MTNKREKPLINQLPSQIVSKVKTDTNLSDFNSADIIKHERPNTKDNEICYGLEINIQNTDNK